MTATSHHVRTATASQTGTRRSTLLVVLGLLTALGPFTIDLYLPALPDITGDLHASGSAVQLTLTGTLAGLGLGQLIVGPLSDVLGRRRPLLAGIAVHVLASLLCAISSSVFMLGTMRVLQGLGAAATAVVAMAVVRDRFSGSAAAAVLSRLILVVGVSPLLAPTVGGELLRWTDWRGIFVALAVIGAAIGLIAARTLPETLPRDQRRTGGLRTSLADYRRLLRDKVFVGLVLVTGLSMAALFAYVAGSSFVLQNQYGFTEQQFGLAFAVNAIALVATPQVNVVLLRRFTPQRILHAALVAGALLALALLILTITGIGGLPGLLVALFLILCAFALRGPNATALGLSRHGEAAGTAASLLGAVQFGVGGLAAPLVGLLGNDALGMAIVITVTSVAAVAVLLLLVHPGRLDGSAPRPADLGAAGR